jgi:DNA polymerase elongation subunit (family B)
MKHTARQVLFDTALAPDLQYTNATTISNKVFIRARKADGTPVFVEQKYMPVHYTPIADASQATHRGFDDTPLIPHMSTSLREAREWIESTKVPVYGDIQAEYMLLADSYKSKDVVWDLDRLYIWNLDIEVASDKGFAKPEDPYAEVISITVRWRHMGKSGVVVYGLKPYTPVKNELYIHCKTEEELLLRFLDDLRSAGDYPDIITGWYVQFFDMPYLINRMKRLFTEDIWLRISPYERISDRTVIFDMRPQNVVDIRGVTVLDYLELYRKFILVKQENYRLDTIAAAELKGKRKLSFAEYKNLRTLYEKDPQKFIEYNIQDVELVDELDQKLKLIELVCALAYSSKANFTDTMKQVRLWDIMIYHKLRNDGKQIPPRKAAAKTEQYAGAYVKEPIPGFYKWVCSFDVASMYPHIIREWNLSPETKFRDHVTGLTETGEDGKQRPKDDLIRARLDLSSLKAKDYCVAANGVLTERHKEGFLPEMLKTLYDERIRYKKLQQAAEKQIQVETDEAKKADLTKQAASYANQQKVRKVNLNSAYGAMGSAYFRFYDTALAEAVTITGQMVIRWIANDINDYLNHILKTTKDYIIASDTDSVYIDMTKVAELVGDTTKEKMVEALHQFCDKKIQPLINDAFLDIADYMNVATPCMSMVRDVIADNCIWTGKKHYVMNVYDSEGDRYKAGPKLKVMGMEMVKSSTPAIVRKMLKTALQMFVDGKPESEMWKHIAECEKEFRAGSFEDIAFPRSVNNMKKFDLDPKGAPIQVTAALTYNKALARMDMLANYEQIRDGEKIKFAYLRKPNPFHSHVIGATHGCPPEWKIEQWIDYTQQFEKAFLTPLTAILTVIGWTNKAQPSVFD